MAQSHSPTVVPGVIQVRADHREIGSGTVVALRSMPEVEVSVVTLDLGDYEVDGRLLFERKSLPDLVASIKDGRLFQQAQRLASASTTRVVILEGTSRELAGSDMRREAIQGALITVSLVLGIPLLRSLSPQESAQLMIYAAKQLRTIAEGGLPRKGTRPKGKRRTQLYILQGLPGVGPERARRLLDAFGSAEAVFAANAADLVKVSGIGKDTADAIRWAVSEAEPAYRRLDEDPAL